MTPEIDWAKYLPLIGDDLPDFDQEDVMTRCALAVHTFLEKDVGFVRGVERRVEVDLGQTLPIQAVWDIEMGDAETARGIVDWKSSFESIVEEWQWRTSSAQYEVLYGRLPEFFEYRVLPPKGKARVIRVDPVPARARRETYDFFQPIDAYISAAASGSAGGFWSRNFRACKGCPGYIACRGEKPPETKFHGDHLSKSSAEQFLFCPESLRAGHKQQNRYMVRGLSMHRILAEIWRDHALVGATK